jgi:hypothetical protein
MVEVSLASIFIFPFFSSQQCARPESFYIIPPPCFAAASPCIFSETLTLTSKNLLTQRSRHTDSPLLRSASRY